jgi:hypothetical protein
MGDPGTAAVKVAPAVARGLFVVAWRRWRPDTSYSALTVHADELADKVRRAEIPRLEQLGVTRGQLFNLSFGALARVRAAGGQDLGTLRDVWDYYRGLNPGRLVVLGEAGAGKTVLGLHLLLDLLDHRDDQLGGLRPVPVRINAASWSVAEDVDFSEWLAVRLAADYAVLIRVARKLVAGGLVLPFLDGLDEMDPLGSRPRHARAAIDQINRSPWRGRPIVVMCRTGVYEEVRELRAGGADAGVHAATAVSLSPLSSEEICEYLSWCRQADGIGDEAWEPVTDALKEQPDGILAGALATPWLLTLAVTRLRQEGQAAATAIAAAPDQEALRTNLFATLIPMAVAAGSREGREPRYTVEQSHRWLAGLAQHLSSRRARGQGGTDIALHQVWQLAGPRAPRYLHGLLVGLVVGLSFYGGAVLVGLVSSTVGLLCGLAAGLVWGLAAGLNSRPSPHRLAHGPGLARASQSRLRVVLALGLVWGLLGGLLGLLSGGIQVSLVLALAVGLPLGLAIGFVSTLGHGRGQTPVADERHIIREDSVFGLVAGLIFGVMAGLILGVMAWLKAGLIAALILGFLIGLIIGLAELLTMASASVRYACGSVLLARRGTFSGRPAAFLHWAQLAGLLRVTGGAYQFRHETFLRWLTEHPEAPASQRENP